MVAPERPNRVRAFTPKTRTGCLTCRSRHLKCDEAKPFCLRCTGTGRKCGGYTTNNHNFKSKSKSTSNQSQLVKLDDAHYANVTNRAVCSAVTSRVLTAPFVGTTQELHSFHYFQQETIPQVCGFYNSDFWGRPLLQACCRNSAIRHAAIALGSLHERQHESVPSKVTSYGINSVGFPLQQYNKAIRLLLRPAPDAAQPDVDVALITCLLFICFDALRGHIGSVLSHIDGGVKILSELQTVESGADSKSTTAKLSTSSFVPMATLNKLFSRLDIQATGMVSSRPLRLVPKLDLEALVASSEAPQAFNSLEEARLSQEYIHSCWGRSMQLVIPEGVEGIVELKFAATCKENLDIIRTEYTEKIQQWHEAFEAFLALKMKNPDGDELQAIRGLKLQQLYISVYADIDHQAAAVDETVWDPYTSQFQQIVALASDILSHDSIVDKPLLSLDTGIVGPLYLVASRCRNPSLRRRAIACLKSTKRHEGLWESRVVGHVAQQVMEIEEAAAGVNIKGFAEDDAGELDNYIPSWARVRGIQPEFGPNGSVGIVHYIRHGSNSEEPFKNSLHEMIAL